MEQFISKEILDELSYTSTLGQSLKQISLSKIPIEQIIQDIGRYRASYVDIFLLVLNLKVMILYIENMKKHLKTKVDSNNASMMFLGSGCI